MVYRDEKSSFAELLTKDGSVTVHHRNLQFLVIEMYKVYKGIAPSIMSDIFGAHPNENSTNVSSNTRSENFFYHQPNPKSVKYGLETLSSLGPKIWKLVPNDLKRITSLPVFKVKIRKWIPDKCPCRSP